ncbi:hypothetical protein LCGC14_2724670, partial [marine sediment metagenome]
MVVPLFHVNHPLDNLAMSCMP